MPLFDVISVAISEFIGSPLTADLFDPSAAQTSEDPPLGSLSIQPPQPPQRDYLPIRFDGSGSLTCSIGVFCPCRISSGGNVDFLPVPCHCILPYAADRLEGQCILRGCRVTSRREINVAGRRKINFLGFEIKQMRKIYITAVRSDEVLGINGVARTPHIIIMRTRSIDRFLTTVPMENFSI